jgi:hypothetical protein
LETIKHEKRTNGYEMVTNGYKFGDKSPIQYCCECGKTYKHRQNLYVHRKKCEENNEKKIENNEIFEKNNEKNEEINYKELFIKIMEQQNTIISELIPKIGNNNNTINQKLNMNFFLNEQCKDAISLNEFVKNIDISVSDLLLSKDKGLIKGISNLIITHLNKLPIIQRPLWCSDKKRKKIYIKEDKWNEDIDNNKTKEAIYNISKLQTSNINKYIDNKPDWLSCDSEKKVYIDIVKSLTEPIDNSKKDKIIDSLLDTIHFTENKIV